MKVVYTIVTSMTNGEKGFNPSITKGSQSSSASGYADDNRGDQSEYGHTEDVVAAADASEKQEQEFARLQPQDRLRASIEAQDLAARNRFTEIKTAMVTSLDRGGILIFEAPTGAGKSIYGPLAARDVIRERGLPDHVVVLEPRRDAASGIGTAMAAVADEELGREIGFSTADTKQVRMDSSVKVITPGIFLRWLKDGTLTKDHVGALVIDEAHENSIEYHLIYGLIKQMQNEGVAPPVIFMSATPDTEKLQAFYGLTDEDRLKIEGHPHQVETFFAEKSESDYISAAVERIHFIIDNKGEGDILVFLPGSGEINAVKKQLSNLPSIEILPLHGNIPPEQRREVLSGNKKTSIRRIILSTNIAETSVTVPGVGFVVDSCRERDVRFDSEAGIVRKGTGSISQTQAKQRQGRAGRTRAGECYRLLTEEEFTQLPERPEANIHRENLAHLILQLKNMGIEPTDFPFIDPPKAGRVENGIAELQMLGALDQTGAVTDIGKKIGELKYFEPRIGRMIIEAQRHDCQEAALVLAAFERESKVFLPLSNPDAHSARNAKWNRGNSDWLMRLKVFCAAYKAKVYAVIENAPSSKQKVFYDWCRDNSFSAQALIHLASRLDDYAECLGLKVDDDFINKMEKVDDGAIGQAILAAHPDMVFLNSNDVNGYVPITDVEKISKGKKIKPIHPGSRSVAFNNPPNLCVGKVTEDKGLWIDIVHPITFEQLRQVTPHLLSTKADPASYMGGGFVGKELHFYPVGAQGMHDYELGIGMEKLTTPSPELAEALARALVEHGFDEYGGNGEDYEFLFSVYEDNYKMVEYSKKLRLRSAGRVPKFDLVAWYAKKLAKAVTLDDARNLREQLKVQPADICSPELLAEIDRDYPTKIIIKNVSRTISYNQEIDDPLPPLVASVDLNDRELFAITQADIPVIGSPSVPLHLTISIFGLSDGCRHASQDIAFLQEKFDLHRLNKLCGSLKIVEEWINVDISDEIIELPTLEQLGHKPVEFARDFHQQPVFVYPGIFYDVYSESYRIQYFRSKEKADAKTQGAVNERPNVIIKRENKRREKTARAEVDKLRRVFEEWERKEPTIYLKEKIDWREPLPTPAELGYVPKVYTTATDGQPQYAYPWIESFAVNRGGGIFGNVRTWDFKLKYSPTEAEAIRQQAESAYPLKRELESELKTKRAHKVFEEIEDFSSTDPDNPFTEDEIKGFKDRVTPVTPVRSRGSLRQPISQAQHHLEEEYDKRQRNIVEKVGQEMRDIRTRYETEYKPLRERVEHLKDALVRYTKYTSMRPDMADDYESAVILMDNNDIANRRFRNLSSAIKGLQIVEGKFKSIARLLDIEVSLPNESHVPSSANEKKPRLRTEVSLSSESHVQKELLSADEEKNRLVELDFWGVFMETQPKTEQVKDIIINIDKIKTEITTPKNKIRQMAKLNHRIKPFLNKASHEGGGKAWSESYRQIIHEFIPKIQAEYGGVLTSEAMASVQIHLLQYAKELSGARDDAQRQTIQEKIETMIAEKLA